MIYSATGHRPDKLGGYGDDVRGRLTALAIAFLERNPPEKIITGMALGWDLAWAQAGLLLKIPVIAAIPFKGQEGKWPQSSQDYYNNILDQCSEVVEVNPPGYQIWKMFKRNEYMVDNSDVVVALWDGSKGGTYSCVSYAEKQKKKIINLWNRYEEQDFGY